MHYACLKLGGWLPHACIGRKYSSGIYHQFFPQMQTFNDGIHIME